MLSKNKHGKCIFIDFHFISDFSFAPSSFLCFVLKHGVTRAPASSSGLIISIWCIHCEEGNCYSILDQDVSLRPSLSHCAVWLWFLAPLFPFWNTFPNVFVSYIHHSRQNKMKMKLNEVNMRENLRMGNHFSVFPSTQIFIHFNSSRDENQMKMKYWFPKEINIFLFSHTQPPIPFIISAKYFPADYLHYDGNGKSMQLEIKILYFYFGIFLSPVLFDNNC